ncbi:MAG TPA: AtpZ/AtpI family protein [Mesorhizobium sp.]|nr:AtpZ/AtpI family protein [Mesorhizobium sp.]
MATPERPDRPGGWSDPGQDAEDRELERRKRQLEAKLSAHPVRAPADEGRQEPKGGMAGLAQGLKLSSEFIAGIAVGAGLGWAIDLFAGTSPWGLIIFLMLGFAAGVLNVLRSVGRVAPSAVPGPGEANRNLRAPGGPDRGDRGGSGK